MAMLDQAELAKHDINYDAGMNRFMGKEALFERFLLKFPSDPSYDALVKAVESGDCGEAFSQAHTLKGVTANLALDGLFKVADQATEAFRAGDFEAGKAFLPQITDRYNDVIAFLKGLQA